MAYPTWPADILRKEGLQVGGWAVFGRWRSGVRTGRTGPERQLLRVERDVHLRGRGVLVLPSYFCRRYPTVLRDARLPPVVVHPLTHQAALDMADPAAEGNRTPSRSLVALLGGPGRKSSAASPRAAVRPRSRPAETGMSPATAGYHTTVLRDAGLLSTHCLGNAVLHTPTPLGAALLEGRRRSAA